MEYCNSDALKGTKSIMPGSIKWSINSPSFMEPEGSLPSSEEPLDTILNQVKSVHTFITSSLHYLIHSKEVTQEHSLINLSYEVVGYQNLQNYKYIIFPWSKAGKA
jgi:hypothetical protein